MKLKSHRKINVDTYELEVCGMLTLWRTKKYLGIGHEWRLENTGKMVKNILLLFALYKFFKDLQASELLVNPNFRTAKIKDHELLDMMNQYKLEITKSPDRKRTVVARNGIHGVMASINYNGTDVREALKAYYIKYEEKNK